MDYLQVLVTDVYWNKMSVQAVLNDCNTTYNYFLSKDLGIHKILMYFPHNELNLNDRGEQRLNSSSYELLAKNLKTPE